MKKDRTKKSKKAKLTVRPQPEKVNQPGMPSGLEADEPAAYGGFPERDLKKNLGCG